MCKIIKDKAISMGKYMIQSVTILIMMAAFTLPAVASQDTKVPVNRLINSVADDVKYDVEAEKQLLAGKKRKGGTRRFLPPGSYEEMPEFVLEQLMAGKKKKGGTSGRRRYIGRV